MEYVKHGLLNVTAMTLVMRSDSTRSLKENSHDYGA